MVVKVLLLVFVLGAIVYFFAFSTFFNVTKIRIRGATHFVSETDLMEMAKTQAYEKNILTFNTRHLQDLLQQNFQGAERIRVQKKLPNTLKIDVEERVPLAIIHNERSDQYYIIDLDGYVLGLADQQNTNLPKIQYEQKIHVGEFIDKNLVPIYLELREALGKHSLKASSISFYPRYTKVFVEDGKELILGNARGVDVAVKAASDLLKQVILEGGTLRKIDLRYDKVVVE